MTTFCPHRTRASSLATLAVLTALWALGGCIGGGSSAGGGGNLVKGGDACATDGASADALDGCNTCTCVDGTWTCTRAACPAGDGDGDGSGGGGGGDGDGSCVVGDSKNADDGCNTCTCSGDGLWACTQRGCGGPPADGSGGSDQPGTGGSGGGCTPGDTMPADDGCNTCTCAGDGGWACTEIGCNPNPGAACGARAGDTCEPTEYCAYQEGAYCGAADAESVCMERPQICTRELSPVCGCDGKDYNNPCEANAAGTGILHSGAC